MSRKSGVPDRWIYRDIESRKGKGKIGMLQPQLLAGLPDGLYSQFIVQVVGNSQVIKNNHRLHQVSEGRFAAGGNRTPVVEGFLGILVIGGIDIGKLV